MTQTIKRALDERTRIYHQIVTLAPHRDQAWLRTKAARMDAINSQLRELGAIPGRNER